MKKSLKNILLISNCILTSTNLPKPYFFDGSSKHSRFELGLSLGLPLFNRVCPQYSVNKAFKFLTMGDFGSNILIKNNSNSTYDCADYQNGDVPFDPVPFIILDENLNQINDNESIMAILRGDQEIFVEKTDDSNKNINSSIVNLYDDFAKLFKSLPSWGIFGRFCLPNMSIEARFGRHKMPVDHPDYELLVRSFVAISANFVFISDNSNGFSLSLGIFLGHDNIAPSKYEPNRSTIDKIKKGAINRISKITNHKLNSLPNPPMLGSPASTPATVDQVNKMIDEINKNNQPELENPKMFSKIDKTIKKSQFTHLSNHYCAGLIGSASFIFELGGFNIALGLESLLPIVAFGGSSTHTGNSVSVALRCEIYTSLSTDSDTL